MSDVIEIKLGGKRGGIAIVDADYSWVSKYSWHENDRGYISTHPPRNGAKQQETILLHHLVMGKPEQGLMVDHINHDPLDNRKSNLRICTNAQNQHNQKISRANTTGFKGVSLNKQSGKYRSHIWLNKRSVKLGTFDTPEEAHQAYKEAAIKHRGEFAYA